MSRNRLRAKTSHKILITILLILVITAGIFVAQDIIQKYTNSNMDNASINSNETDANNQKGINNVTENSDNKEETNNNDNDNKNIQSEEIFSEYYQKAEELMNNMTLEEKVGQMFLARYPETGVIEEIKENNPGGYILFSRDFKNETKASILKELENCQNASKINLALGVDEEGGTVVRVSEYKTFRDTKFLSPQKIWAKGQLPAILEDSKEKSELLKSIGLNMNLVPVADVPSSSKDFIYSRAYGRGAEKTAIYVSELIKTMNESNMISTMKHFPGYGNNVDTHTGIAIDKRPYSTFENSDFLPFKAGIEANAPTILVSHNIVNCMDENNPASLSEKVHDILRKDLEFSGIIMTDDLAMDAVKTYVENGEAAVQAVLAGNDMIISSDFIKQKNEIVKAVNNGKISKDIIDKAVKRILAWKYTYKIIN